MSSPLNPIYLRNKDAWDARARKGKRHAASVLPKDLRDPLPILDPEGWLGGKVRGMKVLCLASGGGLQSAMLAAAGAEVTVVDISSEMLNLDRKVALEHGLKVTCLEASMESLPAADASFDVVLQPVSTCYVPEISAVYREVRRVIRPGGIYISQHKQPASLQASISPGRNGYEILELYNRSGPLPPTAESLHREADTLEFLHTWTQIAGGLCRAGFVIEDLVEPRPNGGIPSLAAFAERSRYLPPYVKLKARAVKNDFREKAGNLLIV
ncbi:MAG: Methyltransferase type 11 [Verrucomicrobiales bacterium]|nr:Methyltransferase type 11 [Verrucomicrobiales bacterium]